MTREAATDLASSGLSTISVHAGLVHDASSASVSPDLSLSVNYTMPHGAVAFSGLGDHGVPFVYAREGHPNAAQLAARVAALEGAEDAAVFASGMAAITGVLLHLLSTGDHLVVSDVSYVGTAQFVREFLPRMGIEVTSVDLSDVDALTRALRPETKVVFAESPCNPILRLTDLAAVAEVTQGRGAKLVVDSTFATPTATRPLDFGADYVVHSLTKYLCGHGDALGGVVVASQEAISALSAEIGVLLGATLSPFNCWLILRGIETLPVRMRASAEGAQRVAEFLEAHPGVRRVMHPGLASHPQHDLARRQMAHAGGMIAFQVADPDRFGSALADAAVVRYAVSLGENHTVICYCDTEELQDTTFKLDEEGLARYRQWAGDGVFRLSVGLEDPDDICRDLDRALSGAQA